VASQMTGSRTGRGQTYAARGRCSGPCASRLPTKTPEHAIRACWISLIFAANWCS
jgi:hypothetical protein